MSFVRSTGVGVRQNIRSVESTGIVERDMGDGRLRNYGNNKTLRPKTQPTRAFLEWDLMASLSLVIPTIEHVADFDTPYTSLRAVGLIENVQGRPPAQPDSVPFETQKLLVHTLLPVKPAQRSLQIRFPSVASQPC